MERGIHISRLIGALRQRLGISQEKLAEQLRVSGRTISQWEMGVTRPDAMALHVIEQYIQRLGPKYSDLRERYFGKDKALLLEHPMAPAGPASAAPPARAAKRPAPERFDVFISHASEDKDSIARPLYQELSAQGVTVWFDEAVLELGDSLRRKIDEGLTKCRYGVVILSPHFFRKQWPQKELDGLVAREMASGEKAVLPVWHEIDRDAVLTYSPTLADRVAARSEEGVALVAEKILAVLKK